MKIGGLWREYVLSEFGGHRRTVALAGAGEAPAVELSRRTVLFRRLSVSTLSLFAAAACVVALVAGGIVIATQHSSCLFSWHCGTSQIRVVQKPVTAPSGTTPCVVLCDVRSLQPVAAAAAVTPAIKPIVAEAVSTPPPVVTPPPAVVPAPTPLQTVGGVVQQVGTGLVGTVTGVVNGLVSDLVPALSPAVSAVSQVVGSVVTTLTNTVGGLLSLLGRAPATP